MISRSVAADLVACGILLAFGITLGSFVSTHFAGHPRFYQEEFGPAVMSAAGHGFANPVVMPGSPVAEFLSLRRSALDASSVPVSTQPLDQFQYAHRYLMLSVASVWRLSGISWESVSRVGALLCGLTVVASYLLFRLWVPVALSATGAVFLALTPLHLAQIPHVRDYAKAPFIVIAIALTAAIVLRPMSRGLRIGLSAACGAIVGVGLGFKMDVAAMAPLFVASVLLFAGARPWCLLVDKSLAIAAFAAALAIAGAPVFLRLSSGGSNGFHAMLLGNSDPFDATLGLTRPAYSVLPVYDDGYVTTVVKEYGARLTGTAPPMPSAEYDAAGRTYWLTIARHFPADVAARTLGAANTILNLPFDNPALSFLTPPASRNNPFWDILTNQPPHRARIGAIFERLAALDGAGMWLGLMVIAAAAAHSVRLGLFGAWMTIALAGYASLQFAERHVFHLQVIPILGLLAVADILIRRRFADRRARRRFAGAAVAVTLSVLGGTATLNAYQSAHVRELFESYIDGPRQPLAAAFADTGHGTWRANWTTSGTGSGTPYYMVEFDGAARSEIAPIEVRYRATPGSADYSRVITMKEDAGVNRVLFAGYTANGGAFDGIEMPAGLKDRVRGLYRVTPEDRLAPFVELRLTAGWKAQPLYQSLRAWSRVERDRPDVYSAGSARRSNITWLTQMDSPAASPDPRTVAMSYVESTVLTPGSIAVDAHAPTQSSYLLEFQPVTVTGDGALLVRGRVFAGALSVGLLENGQWHRQVTISDSGDFVAVVAVDHPGTFVPIITNATKRDRDRTRFTLSRFGVVGEN